MMTSTIEYLGGLRTKAVHLRSNTEIITDAPVDNQGQGQAFSPTDLAATSLASCLITIMGIAAQQHDIDIQGAKAELTKHMASDPRRIARIEIKLIMPALDYSSKEKKILEAAAHHCPVSLSLNDKTIEDLTIVWP